jgi:hypothetical protein
LSEPNVLTRRFLFARKFSQKETALWASTVSPMIGESLRRG